MGNLRPQNTFITLSHTKESAYGSALSDGSIDKRYDLVETSLAQVDRTFISDMELIKGTEFAVDTVNTGALVLYKELHSDVTIPGVWPGSYELAGLLWSLALGNKATTGAGPYTHTLLAQDPTTSGSVDQLPSTTIVQGVLGDTASYYKYKGCVVNELRMNVNTRGRMQMDATFFTDGTSTAAPSFTVPARNTAQTAMYGRDATFKMGNAGSALTDYSTLLRSFEINWNNALARDDSRSQITAGVNLPDLRFGTRQLTVTIRIQGNKGDAFWTDMLNATQKDIELKFTSGTNSITFNIDRCVIAQARDSFEDIRNVLELTIFPFTKSITVYSPMEVVVVNSVATYL
jgi:hypothetical protein